jgi:dihydrofolate synthase/folylpolyglutamate synthase
VDDDLVRDGLGGVRLPGRLETVSQDPTVIIDGAHNPHGAQAIVDAVGRFLHPRSTILVFGCLRDKDPGGLLSSLAPLVQHVVIAEAPAARAAPLDDMLAAATKVFEGTGVAVESAASLEEAVELATGVAGPGDVVLATGSLYVAGAVRDRYQPVDESMHLVVPLDDEDVEAEEPSEDVLFDDDDPFQ